MALALISNTKTTQVNSLKPTLLVVEKIFRRTITITTSSNCNYSIKKTKSLCQVIGSSKVPVRGYSYSKTLSKAVNKQSLHWSRYQYNLYLLYPNLTTPNILLSPNRNMSVKSGAKDNPQEEQINARFLDCAAKGELEELKKIIGLVDVDVKSERGWTALMLAARNGQTAVISFLIEKGCDVYSFNAAGQTALDIAHFWNHKDSLALLSQHQQNTEFNQVRHYYSQNPLYRASDVRKDEKLLEAAQMNKSAKFVLFSKLCPFLIATKEPKKQYKFAVFMLDQLPQEFKEQSTVIFLGLETFDPESSPWFAIELKDMSSSFANTHFPDGNFVPAFPTTLQMRESDAGMFAEAHSILSWLDRYKYCPVCGSAQSITEGGYKQVCSNTDCLSHKGVSNTCYPRVDPSLIMLVVSPDNKQCLLGRQNRFPPKMFSCLAGFMEPGESIEDTCRREIEEESGVKVGRVEYHSSQPWPFPATLMLGCIAHARTDTIKIDKEELEEVRWFSRSETSQMLANQHPDGLFLPPRQAIAHQLIRSWITSCSSNL
ncbi:NAD-capped RNA hydrolase NUDT12-like isoform X3 [Physella acuta]|uniref:NAD-capped RNA hydrolase NUDT12-like isoform X2 n=1 Tax=Physella acuta TaxID=109671 RepID=UPI0027DBB301|nr:NAD-capped RNA hydrolase NUDT12-like isoform X2 [Physella acuta]XP_059174610.1 NAD-capped RNA hydrolase NUDT12-like isoform X3 [Physella acuta]